ncbi:hypothetical protein D4764_05G0001280 [Takifugu flavidus]|uniref:Uncharacterized protein n=1 Tax=Takifugu flavidus TaxID=433684 RepID=A0A5C6N011_9TELE|nr:hypothetical protein D4764_05G0001280 [Takifugu flavidus]
MSAAVTRPPEVCGVMWRRERGGRERGGEREGERGERVERGREGRERRERGEGERRERGREGRGREGEREERGERRERGIKRERGEGRGGERGKREEREGGEGREGGEEGERDKERMPFCGPESFIRAGGAVPLPRMGKGGASLHSFPASSVLGEYSSATSGIPLTSFLETLQVPGCGDAAARPSCVMFRPLKATPVPAHPDVLFISRQRSNAAGLFSR